MHWMAYHLQYNQEYYGLESGERKEVAKPLNGYWSYEDNQVQLQPGDIVYCWLQITFQTIEYNRIDQEFHIRGESKNLFLEKNE